ncbi:MED24 isoform 21, partial [Pongo abelii]
LLEQAMIGPSPNPLILSYLKYAISSQMVSYSSVLTAINSTGFGEVEEVLSWRQGLH